MGVQKPTRHTRQLSRIPARRERVHMDVREVLNRRAEIARAARLDRTPQTFANVEGQYAGFEVSGTGPAGVLNQPLGNEHRPGMPGVTVSREHMIHAKSHRIESARAKKQRTGTK